MQKDPEKKDVPVAFRTITHLYDPDDPSPENTRELSDRAEADISHAVLDMPHPLRAARECGLTISIPASEFTPGRGREIPDAVRSHFLIRAAELRRSSRLIRRVGIREFRLTIAVCIPAFTGIALLAPHTREPFAAIASNVLTIFSWVVIWQPFQSLVFDRWTQSVQAKVYRQIAEMEMKVIPR